MSSPKPYRLQLAPKAQQDFVDILRYTASRWGAQQLLVYRDQLDAALQEIAKNPQIGQQRADLPPTHRAFLVGVHVIVYRLDGERVGVVRILHQRMSLPRHFS